MKNPTPSNLVTIKMVAAQVPCHYSTVSLALRDHPSIPEATRSKIKAVASNIGYRTNPLVATLMASVRRQKTATKGTIGYVFTTTPNDPRLKYEVCQEFHSGAKARAAELGYGLDVFYLHSGGLSEARLNKIFWTRKIHGVVINNLNQDQDAYHNIQFDWEKIAAACVGVPITNPRLHYAANDQFQRPLLAMQHLMALGYKRIGLAIPSHTDALASHRFSGGYLAMQHFLPLEAQIPIHFWEDNSKSHFKKWLSKHKPDAVLGQGPEVLAAIEQCGFSIPEQIGWCTLDRNRNEKAAGIYRNSERTGAAAVDLVVSQIHRNEFGPPRFSQSILVEGTWIDGSTVHQVGPPLVFNNPGFDSGSR